MKDIKTPPNAQKAEEAILGSILLDEKAISTVLEYLTEDAFYLKKHRVIFNVMCELFEKNQTIDLVTVNNVLSSRGLLEEIGGSDYLTYLLSTVISTANLEQYCKLVLEKAILRRLIEQATEIIQDCYNEDGDAHNILDQAEQRIFDIKVKGTRKTLTPIRDPLEKLIKEAEERMRIKKGLVTGYPTGFARLDELTCGFQPGDLVIIAGRPSSGKTALALNIATYSAMSGFPTAIFSLEMTAETLLQRILCAEAGLSFQKFRRGTFETHEWVSLTSAYEALKGIPLFIDDSAAMKVLEIKAKARRLKATQNDLGMIFIDYLQLIEPHSKSREKSRQQEITEISRALKGLAKELNVPVVALSQLSRLPERRQDKRPQLADLRESGAIEQDADVVLLLYRPEIYEDFKNNPNFQGWADLIIAKQRNGPQGVVRLTYRKECMRFETYFGDSLPELESQETEEVL